MSASEVLRNRPNPTLSRFVNARNQSNGFVANSNGTNFRERVDSVKRKASAEISSETAKKHQQERIPSVDGKTVESMGKKLNMLKGICGKLNDDAPKLKVDIGLENVIRSLCEFVDVGSSLMEDLFSAVKAENTIPSGPDCVFVGNPEPEVNSQPTYSQVTGSKPTGAPVPEYRHQPKKPAAKQNDRTIRDPKMQAFVDAVKYSERSTLVFNLNLGNQKTLNEKAIVTKATLALSEAAAEVAGSKGKPPSKETVEILDDVMSVATNVTLYGKVTKPYENARNNKDPRNRTFFTMPVRYDFRDRDTRIEAETILRETCKVECTTPYPIILRHCIKQVIQHVRAEFPKDYVKVTVDAENMALKISRRSSDGWYTFDDPIYLPKEVLDINARWVPDGVVVKDLPDIRRVSDRDMSEMDADPDPVTGPPPATEPEADKA
jgi:hypothetical protein